MILYLEVKIHDRESVEQLSLVFVETLYLDIKSKIGRKVNALMLLDVSAELLLLCSLYCHKAVDSVVIVNKLFKTRKSVKVSLPAVAYLLGDKSGKLGIA